MVWEGFKGRLSSCRPPPQEPMADGQRESAVSTLRLVPSVADAGATFTCHASNPAAPAGRQVTATLDVQCECRGTGGGGH